jgi:hypothetical protein
LAACWDWTGTPCEYSQENFGIDVRLCTRFQNEVSAETCTMFR